MAASNRAKLISKLQTELKKRYKLPPAQPTRPLLEHMLYASLLEDAPADLADEGLAKCEQEFFDWNEVRVTTASELTDVLSRLPDPEKAANRLKSNLQAVFEEFYTFDLDHLKKENLGKAVNKFEKMPGMTPFVLSYTVQHGLGGHSIPIDYSAMVIMLITGIASQPEAAAGRVPGLERAIPKNKGIEFATLLHEPAVALKKSTKNKEVRALMNAVDKGSADRLDQWLNAKRAAKRRGVKKIAADKEAARLAAEAEAEAAAEAARKAKEKAERKVAAKREAERKAAEKAAAARQAVVKKKTVSSSPAKPKKAVAKPAPKKAAAKKPVKTAKKTAKKPAKKAPVKKAKKTATTKQKVAKKKSKVAAKSSTTKKATKKTATKKKATKKTAAKKATKKTAKKATKKKATKKSSKSTNRKLTKRKPR